jgi:glycosyltransferase involved in cell wall biosynthesis
MSSQPPDSIGYFAPLPPVRSGVADYASALLRQLPMARANRSGAVDLYQLGNNVLHREIYARALAEPGVALLHDAVLQHFFLSTLDEQDYVQEFVYNYGEWSRDLGRNLWRNRARSGSDIRYFEYPMLRRIAETSRAIVVHNPAAAAMVLAHAVKRSEPLRVHEIPHLFEPPAELPAGYEIERLRERLGVGPRTFLFAVFGYLRESKRILSILRAFTSIRGTVDAALLIAGELVSDELARACDPFLTQPGILRVGHLSEADFWRYAAACDACLNLRYPSAGETSGIGVRLMGIGKPVMFTEGGEIRNLPQAACIRIDSGAAETAMLSEMMQWLARFPAHARAMGRLASQHIAEHHNSRRCAGAVIDACAGVLERSACS